MNEGETLVERVRRRLADSRETPSPARLAAAVRAEGGLPSDGSPLVALERLEDEVLGAGPLAPLLRDPAVTDVLVNGPDEVWVDRGHGLERTGIEFADDLAVRRLVQRLVTPTGRRCDASQPWVDARLPDGTRLHAVLAPIARGGSCISLRTLRRQSLSVADLVATQSLAALMGQLLSAVMNARLSVVVSGGTGTGKTTLLAALLALAAPDERIVIVEDSAELEPHCPHVVALEARPPNAEGAGAVPLRDLVRQALRMRPDRLVVGEMRGAEVVDVLAALNTGHEGGLTTVHANAAAEVPPRLEALALAAGLDRPAIHAQLAAGVHVVIHLRRDRDGRRYVAELAALQRGSDGLANVVAAVRSDGRRASAGPGWAQLSGLLAGRGIRVPALP